MKHRKRLSRRKLVTVILAAAVLSTAALAAVLVPRLFRSPKRTKAARPAAIAKGMRAGRFMDSEEREAWFKTYEDKVDTAAKYREEMNAYYRKMMREILGTKDDSDENVVFSPLNTWFAFSLLAETSEGSTRSQLLDFLETSDLKALRERVEALWESNSVDTPVLKSLPANSIWLKDSIPYKEEILKRLGEQYYADSFRGDPASPEMSRALQRWTEEHTGGLLKEDAKGMKLDRDTVLAVISSIYYRADWTDKFRKEADTKETFHGTAGDSTVEMMHRSDRMSVCRTENFTAVGLSLWDSGGMYFYLPETGASVMDLANDPAVLKAAACGEDETDEWKDLDVHLSVPKFKVHEKTDLLEVLKQLGVKDALDPNRADFSPLTENAEDLYLDKVEHAAAVEVDENGVTGAAYTELDLAATAAHPSEETLDFVLDRPFLFVITGADGSVLFAGMIKNL